MEKEESLKFLQDCINKVYKITDDEINKLKKIYEQECNNIENKNIIDQ